MIEATRFPRVLRHTPGTINALAVNGAHKLAANHALIHYCSGAVFTFIPKNACTSLRVSLALANGAIASLDDWNWVHANNTTFAASLQDLARAPQTAVILRCPFRRLASVFLDKFVSRRPEFWKLYKFERGQIDPDRLSFRAFVEWLGKSGNVNLDSHWRPQAHFLVYQQYDQVFCMDDMDAFSTFFKAVTDQDFVDSRPFSGHETSGFAPSASDSHADTGLLELMVEKTQGRLPRAEDLYDDVLIDKVTRLYAEDLRLYEAHIGVSGLLFPDAWREGAR